MSIKNNYTHTVYASYLAYVTQALSINFTPLLFVIFSLNYGVSLAKLTLLITVNFFVQLTMDFVSTWFVDKIGYRKSVLIAEGVCAIGFFALGILPNIMANTYLAIVIADILYSIGAGLIEVVVNPIIESAQSEGKGPSFAVLHSFYSWGHVFVVAVSTLFLYLFGSDSWPVLACIWALVPAFTFFYFRLVPIKEPEKTEKSALSSILQLFKSRTFVILVFMMISAGASEQAMAQWASAFAQAGLGVDKTVGDLLGPCSFAVLMGISRIIGAKMNLKYDMKLIMIISSVLCMLTYVFIYVFASPVISLICCGACGLTVGIFWPGTLSVATKRQNTNTAMFAMLSLAGDAGCMLGPSTIGFISSALNDNLKAGLGFGWVFPAAMLLTLLIIDKKKKTKIMDIKSRYQ